MDIVISAKMEILSKNVKMVIWSDPVRLITGWSFNESIQLDSLINEPNKFQSDPADHYCGLVD